MKACDQEVGNGTAEQGGPPPGSQICPAPATRYEPVAPGGGNLYENKPGAAIYITAGEQGNDDPDTDGTDSGEEVVKPGDHDEIRRRAMKGQRRRRLEAAGPGIETGRLWYQDRSPHCSPHHRGTGRTLSGSVGSVPVTAHGYFRGAPPRRLPGALCG